MESLAGADRFAVALVTDVFHDEAGDALLDAHLAEARRRGARLAVLPELPLNRWSMAAKFPPAGEAEPPGGRQQRRQQAAARRAGIAVLGGAIVCDPNVGTRYNSAFLIDAFGRMVASYAKVHLPQEPGFYEESHYAPGETPPDVVRGLGPAIGIQICSDAYRASGAQYLAARGVEIILAPRATPVESYANWRLVYRTMALTGGMWVVSVNRPRPELGVAFGAPSLVVAPSGDVVLETVDPVAVLTLDLSAVARARTEYPGYLGYPAHLYAAAWHNLDSSGSGRTS